MREAGKTNCSREKTTENSQGGMGFGEHNFQNSKYYERFVN